MIFIGQDIYEEFARLGVETNEDDHFIILQCGNQQSVFSALGATQNSLRFEARRLAAEKRWRDASKIRSPSNETSQAR